MTDAKLTFHTLALRRALAADCFELAPVAAPAITAYGSAHQTMLELQLALSELPDEARPTTVARFLLPDGVRLEDVEVELARPELPGRLGRGFPVTLTLAIVPDVRADEAAGPAGHWVFVPVLDHACYVGRKEDLARRLTDEIATLPAALALDVDGWRRLLSYAPATLEPIAVELNTTPLAEATGRKALAATGRRVAPPDPPPPVVGRADLLGEFTRVLDGAARRSVLLVGDEASRATCSATPTGWSGST
jgi:hypothetical protein